MTTENSKEFLEEYAKANPYIEIIDEIDNIVASLRVIWLALNNREWLDDDAIEHCAACLNGATDALARPRAIANDHSSEIIESAQRKAAGCK